MSKLTKILLLSLLFAAPAFAQNCLTGPIPVTPNLGLYKPFDHACNWGNFWNLNADILDTAIPLDAPINSSTSGGGFLSACVMAPQSGVNFAANIVATPNEVRFYRCFLAASFTVGHSSIIVSTNAGGTVADGMYSCVPPYPAIVTFSFDTSTLGTKTAATTRGVVPRGCVIFAYTATSTSITTHTYSANAAGEVNAITPNFGIASATASGGLMPANLGVLTGNNSNPPAVLTSFFEY